MHFSLSTRRKAARIVVAGSAVVLLLAQPLSAIAASAWNPTLLVNTESFQTIDEGDSTTNIEIRFGGTLNEKLFYDRTNNRFQFSRGIYVGGNITATGSLSVKMNMSGASLNVDGNSVLFGTLTTSGAIATKANLTINSDADTNDAVLTFGNNTANQTIKFLNTAQKFEFSKGIIVRGTMSGQTLNVDGNAFVTGVISATGAIKTNSFLSGSTLTVDGATTLRGTAYDWPQAQGAANTFLKNDGAGTLTWAIPSIGNSSGGMLSLHPEYPNTVYTASGSTAVGQLTYSGALNADNLYRWTTSRSALQDYWIAARVQVPKAFTHFTETGGILVRMRTLTASAADNYVTVRVNDTGNAAVAVTNNAQLVSPQANVWRTVNIGNLSSGTYTPLGYIKLLIKVAATSSGAADVGAIDVRWSTSTP